VTLLQKSTTDFLALCRNKASGKAAVAICPVICEDLWGTWGFFGGPDLPKEPLLWGKCGSTHGNP